VIAKPPCPKSRGLGEDSPNPEQTKRLYELLGQEFDEEFLTSLKGLPMEQLLIGKVAGDPDYVDQKYIRKSKEKVMAPRVEHSDDVRRRLLLPEHDVEYKSLLKCFVAQVKTLVTSSDGLTEVILANIFYVVLSLSVTVAQLKNALYMQGLAKHFQQKCTHEGSFRDHSFLTEALHRKWITLLLGLRGVWNKQKEVSACVVMTRNSRPTTLDSRFFPKFIREAFIDALTNEPRAGGGRKNHNAGASMDAQINSLIKGSATSTTLLVAAMLAGGFRISEIMPRGQPLLLYPLERSASVRRESLEPFFGVNVGTRLEVKQAVLSESLVKKSTQLSRDLAALEKKAGSLTYAQVLKQLKDLRAVYIEVGERANVDKELHFSYTRTVTMRPLKKREGALFFTKNIQAMDSFCVVCIRILLCKLLNGATLRNARTAASKLAARLVSAATIQPGAMQKPPCSTTLRAIYAEAQHSDEGHILGFARPELYSRVLNHEGKGSANCYNQVRLRAPKRRVGRGEHKFATEQSVMDKFRQFELEQSQRLAALRTEMEERILEATNAKRAEPSRSEKRDLRGAAFCQVLNEPGNKNEFYKHETVEERDDWVQRMVREAFQKAGPKYSDTTVRKVTAHLSSLHQGGGFNAITTCPVQDYADNFYTGYDKPR
jgi:hypothetical protein